MGQFVGIGLIELDTVKERRYNAFKEVSISAKNAQADMVALALEFKKLTHNRCSIANTWMRHDEIVPHCFVLRSSK